MNKHSRVKSVLALCAAVLLLGYALVPGAAAVRLPILTYHHLTRDPAECNSMTVTEQRFRLDMEFLREYGYTPLLPADLVAIRKGEQAMPDRPVMVTFDDGYRSNYDIAYPILQQTGMKAVIAVIAYNMADGTGAGEDARTSLSWAEMREMVASGLVEIGSHTYNAHNPQYGGMGAPDGINGVMRRKGESFGEYRARIGGDLEKSISLITQNTGQAQVHYFAYPFGAQDRWMDRLLDDYGVQISVLSNNGKAASIADGLRGLPRYGIRMECAVAQLLRQTDTAQPALATVSVNGTESKLAAYNIRGSNYVRVRDAAVLLMQTASGFDVQWDSAQWLVELIPRAAYSPLGTENQPLAGGARTVQSLTEPTMADGTAHMVAAYRLDGCTYYKLRSLGELCGFAVDWDAENHVVEITA